MITRCVEKPNSRHKTNTFAGGIGSEHEYEYTLTLLSNSPNDDESVVEAYPGVPRIDSPYVGKTTIDAAARCKTVYIRKADPWIDGSGKVNFVWEATPRFSTKQDPISQVKTKKNPSPIQWPTEIHWGSKQVDVYTGFDVNKKPFVNTAGDPIKDVPPIKIYHAVLTLTRFEATYNAVKAMQYAGKVNSNQWFACPRGTAKMEWPEATLTYVEAIQRYLWKIAYTFEIAPEGWLATHENQGTCQAWVASRGRQQLVDEGSLKVKVACRDEHGERDGGEYFLDFFGKQLKVNTAAKPPVLPNMISFELYKTIDFNQLRLP